MDVVIFPKDNRSQRDLDAKSSPEKVYGVFAEKSPRQRSKRTDLIIYLFLLVLAIGAVDFCFSGLFELLNGGALEQTIFALLTR